MANLVGTPAFQEDTPTPGATKEDSARLVPGQTVTTAPSALILLRRETSASTSACDEVNSTIGATRKLPSGDFARQTFWSRGRLGLPVLWRIPWWSHPKDTLFGEKHAETTANTTATLTLGATRCRQAIWETGEPLTTAQQLQVLQLFYSIVPNREYCQGIHAEELVFWP